MPKKQNMKNFILVFAFVVAGATAGAQKNKATQKQVAKDTIDNRMKGPNDEPIIIGPSGGRYYWKNGKKVYVEYKGNKKKKV